MSSEEPQPVNRCVCADVSFESLHRLAVERKLDLRGLQRETGCCAGCRMCEPYVRIMLATGRTRFPVLSDEQVRRLLAGADDPPAMRRE